MKHVMVDLETMGTKPGAAIVSIGAVSFDPEEGTIDPHTFYRVISLESCMEVGLKTEAATIMWWLGQSEYARACLAKSPLPIHTVLREFAYWWNNLNHQYIWGHGAAFDPVLLESAFSACSIATPWKYKNILDTRTLFFRARWKMEERIDKAEHHALADARYQAEQVSKAWIWMGNPAKVLG